MKKLIIVMLAISLTACGIFRKPEPVVRSIYQRIDIPAKYLECDDTIVFPDPDTLTQNQIGDLLAQYDFRLKNCKNNSLAEAEYVKELNAKIDELNKHAK